jgi:hypothetical protein
MKNERPEDMLLRLYHKNAEMIRGLEADQVKLRKMLAAADINPDGGEPPVATVHQLRVIARQEQEPIPLPASFNLKPMVRLAFGAVFKTNGVTKAQLAEFFEQQWAQKVRLDSLGVILSQMKTAGELMRKNQLWYWAESEGPSE